MEASNPLRKNYLPKMFWNDGCNGITGFPVHDKPSSSYQSTKYFRESIDPRLYAHNYSMVNIKIHDTRSYSLSEYRSNGKVAEWFKKPKSKKPILITPKNKKPLKTSKKEVKSGYNHTRHYTEIFHNGLRYRVTFEFYPKYKEVKIIFTAKKNLYEDGKKGFYWCEYEGKTIYTCNLPYILTEAINQIKYKYERKL